MLTPGIYEQVINKKLSSQLAEISSACKAIAPIDKAEASKVLTQYLSEVVQQGLDYVLDCGGEKCVASIVRPTCTFAMG